jgi:hypothetical protein
MLWKEDVLRLRVKVSFDALFSWDSCLYSFRTDAPVSSVVDLNYHFVFAVTSSLSRRMMENRSPINALLTSRKFTHREMDF